MVGRRLRLSAGTGDWLVDALAPGRRPGTWGEGAEPPPDLLEGALAHGVEGWVRLRAIRAGVALPGVDAAVHAALGRHQRALADLARAHAVLTPGGIDYLVVKGPALLARLYDDPTLRSYVDLDLVVRPQEVHATVMLLESAGFDLGVPDWRVMLAQDVHELSLRSPSGGLVDLHWSLGPAPWRTDTSPPLDVLLARSATWCAGDIAVKGLGAADLAVHVAVHAAADGGRRLLWLCDLRAALGRLHCAPEELAATAAEWGMAPAVGLQLHRLRRTLGVDLPPELQLTGGRLWSVVGDLVDRAAPLERAVPGPSLARLVARSSRSGGWPSIAALAGKSARGAAARIAPDRGGRAGQPAPSDRPFAGNASPPADDPAKAAFFRRLGA